MSRKINEHIHSELFDKEERVIVPSVEKKKPLPPKQKKDYTKAITWISMLAITVILWTIIYNLIF